MRGIAVELLPVCESELHGLDNEVNIAGRIVPCSLQVEFLEDGKRLQQGSPLIPWRAFIEIDAPIPDGNGSLDRHFKTIEIGTLQKAIAIRYESDDFPRDIAFIESIEGCLNAILPRSARLTLLAGEILEHAGNRRISYRCAFPGQDAIRQVDGG